MPQLPPSSDVVNLAQAAELLACSKESVRRYVRAGLLTELETGLPITDILLSRAEVVAFSKPTRGRPVLSTKVSK